MRLCRMLFALCWALVLGLPLAAAALPASPETVPGPVASAFGLQPAAAVEAVALPALDVAGARQQDEWREAEGLPPRFAVTETVRITPVSRGTWEAVDERFQLWRLRITAPGALSLNLGFTTYRLPKGARLALYPADLRADDPRGLRVFTDADNEVHGQLWTPVVLTDDLIVELLMPVESLGDYDLELTAINQGYRLFGDPTADKSGTCNIDVACPEGDDWRDEIASVGVISTGGSLFCTGAMLNNTEWDRTPYFMTAEHCGITAANAASLVIYWNFESPSCGQQGGGLLSDYQTGSIWLAGSGVSDYTLVEMDDPVNPDHHVSFAGWDNSGAAPAGGIAIHHPNADEKSISFEDDPTTITDYLKNQTKPEGTHIRITDWDLGTTEPGSSGSPLFDPDHHVVGQLSGGYADCTNDASDWYGRLALGWDGLGPYLDPLGSGVVSLDTYVPWTSGIGVTPIAGLVAAGLAGGPFTPDSAVFTVVNQGSTELEVTVTASVPWVTLSSGGWTLAGGEVAQVTAYLNAAAAALSNGLYDGVITFSNLTDGLGDSVLPLSLAVGAPELVYFLPLDSDPLWTMEGDWAFGEPAGLGGEYGGPDPVSGFTGANVLGYNLAGDYPPDLAPTHLISTPFDCTGLTQTTLRFRRWLGVEQMAYDHASVSVSNDGVDFTTVWSNTATLADATWVPVELDISAVADGQASVYLRWTMGATDGTWQYCGWNLDDIELWALRSFISATDGPPAVGLALGNHPNPFNPLTRVEFSLAVAGFARLEVYDLQGRRVRTLVAERLGAGPHTAAWDGSDDAGRRLPSGVYFARLDSGGASVRHKMVLLK